MESKLEEWRRKGKGSKARCRRVAGGVFWECLGAAVGYGGAARGTGSCWGYWGAAVGH